DRVVVKIYGRNTNSVNRDISISMEGDTLARVEFPAFIPPSTGASLWKRTGTVLSPLTDGDDIATTGQINLGSVGANIITATNANGDLRLGAGGGTNDLKIDINGNVDVFENLTVAGTATGIAPTTDLHLATKKYVDDNTVISLTDVYPINSIYLSTSSTNPNTTFGFGTWSRVGAGRYIIDAPSGDGGATSTGTALTNAENRAVGQHTHIQDSHVHTLALRQFDGGGTKARSATTGATSNNTLTAAQTAVNQNAGSVAGTNAPNISIFMWKRTA
ncbi:hypothetical protein LCGC14_2900920, partial [marine sediment metagenome]